MGRRPYRVIMMMAERCHWERRIETPRPPNDISRKFCFLNTSVFHRSCHYRVTSCFFVSIYLLAKFICLLYANFNLHFSRGGFDGRTADTTIPSRSFWAALQKAVFSIVDFRVIIQKWILKFAMTLSRPATSHRQ